MAAPPAAVDVEHARGPVLGIGHVYPPPLLRFGSCLEPEFVVVSAGGVGEALGIEPIGGVFSSGGGAGRGGGEGPEEIAVAGEGGVLVHPVVDGDRVVVRSLEDIAGRARQVEVAAAVAQVEHVVFAHFLHLGFSPEGGRHARWGGVGDRCAACPLEVVAQGQSLVLRLQEGGGEGCEAERQQRPESFFCRFHIVLRLVGLVRSGLFLVLPRSRFSAAAGGAGGYRTFFVR